MNFNLISLVVLTVGVLATVNGDSRVSSGEVYKIISATNHTVLDVSQRKLSNGNVVIAYPWKEVETENQLWVAEEISPNVFVFASVLNKNFVLDSSIKIVGEPIIHQRNGARNQQWTIEQVKPNSFTYYIRNVYHNNRVLELDADRNGVSLKWYDEKNINQRWIFAEKN